mgnify:CR=1 FL=1
MQNKIGYHTCSDTGGKHSQVYEEITIANMGGETVAASVVQSVTTYDHATDTVTSGSTVPEAEEAEQEAEQSSEIPQEDVEEPEEPAEEQAEEPSEEQAEEPAEEMQQEDVEEAEEQPAEAEEVEE